MNDETFIQPDCGLASPGKKASKSEAFRRACAQHAQVAANPRRVGRTVLWLATMGVLGFIATVLWCWLAYRTGMAVDQWLFQR